MEISCAELDLERLNFSESGLFVLDITLFFIMFGVALNLTPKDFQRVIERPRAPLTGLISQFLVLPALTLGLVWIIQPCPSFAAGMFLVASCPGGNVSNFMSLLAKGNVALSVSLSAVASSLAIFMTPFNFLFWSGFYPPVVEKIEEISMSPLAVFLKILIILAIPLALGMWTANKYPDFTQKVKKRVNQFAITVFAIVTIVAIVVNFEFVQKYLKYVVLIVLAHNAIALLSGYNLARIFRLPVRDRRTICIETGIQNSGIALAIIFDPVIFNGLGGMAMIAALWGIWHIIAGLGISSYWSRFSPEDELVSVG